METVLSCWRRDAGTSLGILIICLPLVATAQKTDASFDPTLASDLQNILEVEYVRWQVPGVSAAAIVDGQGIWIGTAGSNDAYNPETVTPDLIFGMASITKTVTATAIMLLVEDGKLGLDDRIGDHIEPLRNVDPDITIREILNHTSGVNNHTNHFALRDSIVADFNRVWEPAEVFDRFVGIPFWAPGTAYRYSNSNYLIAGLLIESTGESVSGFVRNRILDPHGLNKMYLSTEEAETGTLAKGWTDLDGNGNLNNAESWYSPAWQTISWVGGAMFSTAEDLVRFGEALFGGQILQPESLEEMLTFVDNGANGYGLGVIRYRPFGVDFIGHAGNTVGYSSFMVCSDERGICVAALVNENARPTHEIVFALIERILAFQQTATSVESERPVDDGIQVGPVYPNPANDQVVIPFSVNHPEPVAIKVHDVLGRLVSVRFELAGVGDRREVRLSTEALRPGIYFFGLGSGSTVRSGSFVVAR